MSEVKCVLPGPKAETAVCSSGPLSGRFAEGIPAAEDPRPALEAVGNAVAPATSEADEPAVEDDCALANGKRGHASAHESAFQRSSQANGSAAEPVVGTASTAAPPIASKTPAAGVSKAAAFQSGAARGRQSYSILYLLQ